MKQDDKPTPVQQDTPAKGFSQPEEKDDPYEDLGYRR